MQKKIRKYKKCIKIFSNLELTFLEKDLKYEADKKDKGNLFIAGADVNDEFHIKNVGVCRHTGNIKDD